MERGILEIWKSINLIKYNVLYWTKRLLQIIQSSSVLCYFGAIFCITLTYNICVFILKYKHFINFIRYLNKMFEITIIKLIPQNEWKKRLFKMSALQDSCSHTEISLPSTICKWTNYNTFFKCLNVLPLDFKRHVKVSQNIILCKRRLIHSNIRRTFNAKIFRCVICFHGLPLQWGTTFVTWRRISKKNLLDIILANFFTALSYRKGNLLITEIKIMFNTMQLLNFTIQYIFKHV